MGVLPSDAAQYYKEEGRVAASAALGAAALLGTGFIAGCVEYVLAHMDNLDLFLGKIISMSIIVLVVCVYIANTNLKEGDSWISQRTTLIVGQAAVWVLGLSIFALTIKWAVLEKLGFR